MSTGETYTSVPIDGSSRTAIATLSAFNLPLVLPWHPEKFVPLGATFHSMRLDNPWGDKSPFVSWPLELTPTIIKRDDGTQSSFKSHSTSNTKAWHDHMSLGLGLGVGLPFLAEVSVTGTYDKDVMENTDMCKTSIRSTVRNGFVSFERQPQLTTEAIILLKYGGGLPAFQAKYGDYFLANYRLGGDTGLMLSGSNASKKELEKFGLTVKVEVLLIEKSTRHTSNVETNAAKGSLSLIGYDTLDKQNWHTLMGDKGQEAFNLRAQASEIITRAQLLDLRVAQRLDGLGIQDGDRLGQDDCKNLIASGLVVELELLPMATLREVIEWVIEDDII